MGEIVAVLCSMRPKQWIKNLFVFAALIFAHQLFNLRDVLVTCMAFASLCFMSSAAYIVNDVLDYEQDQHHPTKRLRPIASGALNIPMALVVACMLCVCSVAIAQHIGPKFHLTVLTYAMLLVLYTWKLKHVVIIDVLALACGYTIRAVSGGVAIHVPISHWLVLCTTLLALLLALGKRRHELITLGSAAKKHRPALLEYDEYLLDQMISIVTASTLIAYVFYTMDPQTILKFGTELLVLTIPFPLYGIFRYLYLIHKKNLGGNPSELIVSDRPLFACLALWMLSVVLIIYVV